MLTVFLAGVMFALRPLERVLARLYEVVNPVPGARYRRPALLWAGLACGTAALAYWAVRGFAADGRFPVLPAFAFVVGVALVALPRQGAADAREHREPRKAAEEAA
jgi:hypothetical protein